MRLLIGFILLALLAGVAYGVSWLSYAPQFSIDRVDVVGAQSVPPQLVADYVETVLNDGSYHFLSRTNMFLYPRAAIEKAVVGYFPRIASAGVSRESLSSTAITVTVAERGPFALWCVRESTADCYLMDDSGFIFAAEATLASTTASSQYVFRGGASSGSSGTNPIGQTFAASHLPGLVALLNFLGQSGFHPQGITVVDNQDFSIPLNEGFFLKASFGGDPETLVKNLQLVLASDPLQGKQSELEYVDLRFGNRVYYKLKGGEQQPAQ